MTTAFEAEASRTSDSVMAPTPEWRTLTRTFSVDMRCERVGEDFDRALHVALEDEVEVLDAGLLDLFGEAFERDAGGLGELRFALLHLAVLRDALGLVAVRHDEEGVAGVGHGFEAEDFDRGGGAGFGDGAAAIVEHGADLAEGVADDVAVAGA